MIKQDQVDTEDFVFLLDVTHLQVSSSQERKSTINSHAAKRMHLKRRLSKTQQFKFVTEADRHGAQKYHTVSDRKTSFGFEVGDVNGGNGSHASNLSMRSTPSYSPSQGDGLQEWAEIDQHKEDHLTVEEKSILNYVATIERRKSMTPCRLGSGQHDPFKSNPLLCSKDNQKLVHFCMASFLLFRGFLNLTKNYQSTIRLQRSFMATAQPHLCVTFD